VLARILGQHGRRARLADPRLAHQQCRAAAAGTHSIQQAMQQLELALAADERCGDQPDSSNSLTGATLTPPPR
jgi:hypothetical protein